MRLIDADKFEAYSANGTDLEGEEFLAYLSGMQRVLEDIDAAPTIDPEILRPRWIPVTERLPDTDKDVLVYATTKFIGGSKIAIDKLEEGEQRPIWLYTHGWFEVTHWMPLPSPRKTGGTHE